jgi:molybdenum cofactor cytidylyltransferase
MTSNEQSNVAIIVLAAGQSSRLGQMKQLVSIKGKSLIENQLEQALKVSNKVYCVLGFNADEIKSRINHLPIKTIINHNFFDGMASSIAAGVAALPADTSAAMIVLVDQWQLTSFDLNNHISNWQINSDVIVVAQSTETSKQVGRENIGPPVIFPQQYFSKLIALTGNKGAKPLLAKYNDKLLKVPLEQAFFDLDTPEQLSNMYKELVK